MSLSALALSGRLTPRQRAIVTRQAQRTIAARHPNMSGEAVLAHARAHIRRVEKSLR